MITQISLLSLLYLRLYTMCVAVLASCAVFVLDIVQPLAVYVTARAAKYGHIALEKFVEKAL